jgi:putative transposase
MQLRSEAYPVTTICNVLGLPRSSFYHLGKTDENAALCVVLHDLAAQYPTYGYRRLTALLRREGWKVNHKRVQRLMAEMGLQRPVKRRQKRTTDSRHPFWRYPNLVAGLDVTYPDQVWVADITYVALRDEFVYLAVIMDVYTRAIRGWHLSRSLDRELTLTVLRRALTERVPLIHHSDQGVQYACWDYTELLLNHGVRISMAAVGKPEENGYAERLMRTIKEEEVALSDYRDFHDARAHIGHFLDDVYTHKRIHSALGYLTPAEFEVQWLEQRAAQLAVK